MSVTTKKEPKYPNITARLTGRDGNAFVILGAVKAALAKGDVSEEEQEEFFEEATAGDYDHLLQTAMRWVSVQ
jgi:hypothetical protein